MTEQAKREPKYGEWWWVKNRNEPYYAPFVARCASLPVDKNSSPHWSAPGVVRQQTNLVHIAPVAGHELVTELVDALKEVVEFRNNSNNGTDWVVDEALAKAKLAGLGE